MQPPEPLAHPAPSSLHFLQFVPCDMSHWVPSGLPRGWKGLPRNPSTRSQSQMRAPARVSALTKAPREELREHRLHVGEDVLCVSAWNAVAQLIVPREENEWGLPEPHLS